MKYLYPYECEKKGLSTPAELQAAIDGNRREGRRSSYGQFDSQMQGQLQQLVGESRAENNQIEFNMMDISRLLQQQSGLQSGSLQQMPTPLSLVQHGAAQSSHHGILNNPLIQPHEIEQRMLQYFKILNQSKEAQRMYLKSDRFLLKFIFCKN